MTVDKMNMLKSELADIEEKYEQYKKGDTEPFTDLLFDAFDIRYDISHSTDGLVYNGVKLTLCFGGPNIFLDTSTSRIYLFWGDTQLELFVKKEILDEIDSIFEESFFGLAKSC
jgi:hypothetical protein